MASTQQVVIVTTTASSSPVSGNATVGSSPSLPFVPQLGRDMYLTLAGSWTGTVQVQRSTNGGTTWNNITVAGGQVWGRYTAPCDEVVETPTDGASTYRLLFTISTGTLSYRLAQ